MTGLSDAAVSRLRAVACWPEFETARYTVTREIGRGGMGIVYEALDEALGRDVAIKVSNAVASDGLEQRIAGEARVLARLEHPGIVPVHDVGRLADGRLFYVMKRVDGRTLTAYVREHADLGERLRIFERICEAVAFAHARGILHRDLKPDNVMVGAFGEVMVMDWGIARSVAAPGREAPGTVMGTHGFMAPEQARGEVDGIDERADVYGLGAILLSLLAPGAPVDIPKPLRSICDRALATQPADRYPSAAALRDDVARYRAREAVAAHRETLFERAGRLAVVYRTPILLVLTYMVMRVLVAIVIGR